MSPSENARRPGRPNGMRGHGLFGSVPIAIAGSIAVSLNLLTPAQAATGELERTRDRAPGKTQVTGPHDSIRTATASAPTSVSATVSPARTDTAAAPASYRVRTGDTVSGIAARFGLSTAAVLALNGLSWKSLIFPGQVLALGGAPEPAATAAPAPAPAPAATTYTVVRGDTVSGIAARFGVRTAAVLSANGLTGASLIFPGQRIAIPGMTAAVVSTPIPAPAPAPVVTAPAPGPAPTVQPGQVLELTDEMRANARLIIHIGRQEGVPAQGIVVALVAAAQESGLRNVRYGDRDSLGLFQQRPSTGWGSPDQVLDPTRATQAFYGGATNPNKGRTRGLLDIPGWTSMSVAQAAQAVQISAFPGAYAKWEASARAWLAQLG